MGSEKAGVDVKVGKEGGQEKLGACVEGKGNGEVKVQVKEVAGAAQGSCKKLVYNSLKEDSAWAKGGIVVTVGVW